MNSTKKRILLISTTAICILFITMALFYKSSSGHFDSSDKYDYLKQGHSISEKKRFDENKEYADKYNKRISNMDKLSKPGKGSKIPDISEVSEAEASGSDLSLYFLFSGGVLNTDQYIDAEDKLKEGIKNLSIIENTKDLASYFVENKDAIEKIYGIDNAADLEKLKTKYSKIGTSVEITTDNTFSKSSDGKILFEIEISNSGISFNQKVILSYANDISMDIKWIL